MDNYFDWDTVFIDNNGNYVIPVVLSKVGNKNLTKLNYFSKTTELLQRWRNFT